MAARGVVSWLGLAIVIVAGGCYSPKIVDGQFRCAAGNCPAGFACDKCGLCVKPGYADPVGCASGARSAGDPGLPGVAFCPGAWQVPGVDTKASADTPCDCKPGETGFAADGKTACTIEDNCASGWHVCETDADASKATLTAAACEAMAGGFWVTRQRGGLQMMPPYNFECVAGGPAVVGCGKLVSFEVMIMRMIGAPERVTASNSTRMSCGVLKRAADNIEMTPMDECADASGGAIVCGRGGAASNITKVSRAGGGVICCKD